MYNYSIKLKIFSYKKISQTGRKTFPTMFFFTDHFKHTTGIKTTCTTPSELR